MWLAGVDGSEEPRLLQVHRRLHFTQDDVAVQPDVAETRDQTEQAAEQYEQDGRTTR